ncbi:afadin- and alpha-actinin-binding protein-like [Chanos chanos]|uniref:Afadin- and alpha-actinin-binding protein-like n=1 Tax=Chanos chanos TaxID=29144 RepID=A0A6J2W4B3_CHACN|nr:afadin- and alpha-actinin-binding protein-like [Chanos chanos]
MHPVPLSRNSYSNFCTFCTEENVSECILYINQELSSLGFAVICNELHRIRELDVVAVLNNIYSLLQLHRHALRTVEDLEMEQVKLSSDLDYQQLTNSRLKDQLELARKENNKLYEKARQLEMTIKTLQTCLKNEKEEAQKLQSIIASRATQYSHDMKRKEREFSKLKERLNHLLTDRKDKKQGIDVLNYIGRSDGRRGHWKTVKTEAKHEGEMYKTLLNDFDNRQRELMVENVELKKVLQQMKKEMVGILSPKKRDQRGGKQEDGPDQQTGSDEEEVCDPGKETPGMSCEHAREKLTNSIRQQWRKLKSHVEKLDNQASMVQVGDKDGEEVISKQTHEEEMEMLKMEIQQCKDFIQMQQQLMQQQLNTPCDEETAALLNDCYVLEEKERLKEEWRTFQEQRRTFEMERKSFTEAAIRLGRERKAFEEDRATWLKHQFLNMTFADHMRDVKKDSKTNGALSDCK